MGVYGPDLDLANRMRRWLNPIGVQVVEIDGWRARGRDYATFDPYGSVNHHTAGPRAGVAPSLGICINGRAGLPGPLCNVHQQRNDVVNVVAAGVANHAGRGGWQGLSGNQSVFGLEIEHCGYPDEPFDERRQDIAHRIHAAFISGLASQDAGKVPQHFEWSTEGKIDFCRPLLPGGPEGFRFRVAQLIKSGPGGQEPLPPVQTGDDEVALHIVIGNPNNDGGKWYVTDWIQKWWLPSPKAAENIIWSTVKAGGKIEHNNGGPVQYPQDIINAIPTIK